MRRLSVVIPNYNYGRFVGSAIGSALALEWPDVEVIVVDDGSTDDSEAVIRTFGSRVTAIFQENSGPRVACNAGFATSTGDVVIFLDSDDVLDPLIAREIAAVWHSGASKVQVQMQRIDADGRAVGGVFPRYRSVPTSDQIRHWMTTTTAYPTPPGSGNAYARSFLDQLFPLDDQCGDATDSACLAAAPFLGDVVTIAKPLVGYRWHGDNRSSLAADPRRLPAQIQRALQRHRFAQKVSGADETDTLAPLFRSRHLLQMRVAEWRVLRGQPSLPTDGPGRMLRDSFANLLAPGPEPAWLRMVVLGWCVATLTAPGPIGRWLVRQRLN
jgi:cellulose synthase/poly-beta-1,6-N-acetylglucosamine synthase-like glycosyltransferase